MSEDPDVAAPLVRVLRGQPTAEELAAVLVVLRSRTGPADPPVAAPAAGWSAYGRHLRRPLVPGPGAWQATTR